MSGGRIPSGATLALRDLVGAGLRLRHAVSRRAGLSETEMTTLDHLSRAPMGPAEVARLLEVSTAASTGIVDRLVERGHAERRPHADDRRRVEVHLTESGQREILGHLAPMFAGLAELDASFTADELAVVERYLRRAAGAFEAVTHPPAQSPPAR
ncbi:MarR family transcriptional regulator [Nocardioides anomalus]|uniref:MarR family transcriptional regulator n=1 Tax=Nocardioides anomalus TaxID=2712223 RepID=A0A6G6WKW7_9ACTN|nr:MarR family transcriptional regulator [Nocardioides anomalus]